MDASIPIVIDLGRQAITPSRVAAWSWFADAEGPFSGMFAVTFQVPESWSGTDVTVKVAGVLSAAKYLFLERAPLRPAELLIDFPLVLPARA